MIKVSVIVPIYNVERYLRKTVDSILSQTYNNIEIVLVDDGSPDLSPAICDSYLLQDDRVKVIHQKNGGVSAARATGLANSGGEWVMFLDGDDWLPQSTIERLTDVIEKNNDIDIICGGIAVFNEKGVIVKKIIFEKILGYQDGIRYRKFLGRRPHGMHGVLYRKEIIATDPIIMNRWITNNEDFIYNLFVSPRVKNVFCISEFTCNHLRRDDGASMNKLDIGYWYKLLNYIRINHEKYNVDYTVYLSYKLSLLNSLIRGKKYVFNYDDEEFNDIKELRIKTSHSIRENLLIVSIKYPFLGKILLK